MSDKVELGIVRQEYCCCDGEDCCGVCLAINEVSSIYEQRLAEKQSRIDRAVEILKADLDMGGTALTILMEGNK